VSTWRALDDEVGNEIIDRLNSLAKRLPIDDTTLAGIEFQAKRLRSSPLSYNVILGMIATLRGDQKAVSEALTAARSSASDGLSYFYANFAISLAEVGANEALQEFVQEGLAKVGGDPSFLRTTISVLCGVGRPFQAATLRQQLGKVVPKGAQEADVVMIAKELASRDITEADTVAYTALIRSILFRKGVRRFGQFWSFANPSTADEPIAIVEIGVPFNAEQCVDAEDELFDLFSANGNFENLRRSIVFKLDPDVEGEESDGGTEGLLAAG
jgi:hypothetical protein